MDKEGYLFNLKRLKKELEEIKDDFSKFDPLTDWTRAKVNPLLNHVGNLMESLKWFPRSLDEKLLEDDVKYFEENIKGLRIVLKSEQDFSRNKK
jgi:hypothetical protein